MTGLLWCLVYATFLPIVWGIAGGTFRARAPEGFDNNTPRRQAASLTGVGERLYGAQQNAWEALAMFTPAVFVATITGVEGSAATTTGLVFCVARTLHGLAYATNLATLRSLIWFVGVGATIYLFVLAA